MNVQQITITKKPLLEGGSQIEYDVDLNGRPFAKIWTFKSERGISYAWHAKTLAGQSGAFNSYAKAERFVRGLM